MGPGFGSLQLRLLPASYLTSLSYPRALGFCTLWGLGGGWDPTTKSLEKADPSESSTVIPQGSHLGREDPYPSATFQWRDQLSSLLDLPPRFRVACPLTPKVGHCFQQAHFEFTGHPGKGVQWSLPMHLIVMLQISILLSSLDRPRLA